MQHDMKIFLISILLFMCLSIYYISYVYKDCVKEKSYKIILLIFLHVIISVFSYTGIFYQNKVIIVLYFYFLLTLLFHWLTNDGKCFLTQYKNNFCGMSKHTQYDVINKTFGKVFTHILLIIPICIAVYKISN